MIWQLSTFQLVVSFGFICCLSYITGWFADGIMKRAAFGHIGNWLIILLGMYTAMYSFNTFGYEFKPDPLFTMACVGGGTVTFFIFMCTYKRLFVR